jgi:hypothetical protein
MLAATNDRHRVWLRAQSPGPGLYFFALQDDLCRSGPIAHVWHDGEGRGITLI